jgi:hypothetical protein
MRWHHQGALGAQGGQQTHNHGLRTANYPAKFAHRNVYQHGLSSFQAALTQLFREGLGCQGISRLCNDLRF